MDLRRYGLRALSCLLLASAPEVPATELPTPPEGQQATAAEQPSPEPTPQPVNEAPRARFHGATEVVASRIAADPAAVGRREVVLDREQIRRLPASTLQDLLAMIPGVGLARRGARGVQGDLNLRGATFEQALVMVNGVRVNNPQTGHHSLDLFLPLAAIERVEVLYGPGSAAHGPDAFGGAINIVTGSPATSAFIRVGEHDLTGGGGAVALGSGLWLAGEREVHTGFRYDTEADVNQVAAGWSTAAGERRLEVSLAAGSRDFGAFKFYSATYPNQYESTSGELVTARASTPLGGSSFAVALRLDRHTDDYLLDRSRPEWYRNRHETRGALLDLAFEGRLHGWDWAAGVEGARDDIDSSNLGDHRRTRAAAFAELGRLGGPHTFTLQARVDHQDPWGTVSTLAGGGSLALGRGWRLRGHLGSSFRAPSFTELHYVSPSRVGNPDLEPERGRTLEAGLDRDPWSLTVFRRTADPIIDYLLGDDGVWRADNLGRVTTSGVEAAVALPAAGRLAGQRIGAVYLDSAIEVDPARSAYALAHPRAEASWIGALDAGRGWTTGWAVRWRDPQSGGSWATVDLRVARTLLDQLTVSLEGANLLDREVTELHGVPLPGRWVTLTLAWRQP